MIAKVFLGAICLIVVFGLAQPASIFQLRPAIPVKSGGKPIFKNCSAANDKFKLLSVEIEGCTAPPCILKKGTTAEVTIDLVAEEVTPNVTASVYGQISGVMVPFPLSDPNACKFGITCPTKNGATYHYKYSLPVEKEYPSVQCVVLWYLKDAQNAEGLCMDVLVKIES